MHICACEWFRRSWVGCFIVPTYWGFERLGLRFNIASASEGPFKPRLTPPDDRRDCAVEARSVNEGSELLLNSILLALFRDVANIGTMANSSTPLAERTEVHKSCKTLESVVNILNDYCEAANAIVSLQKKLAKALRESASAKCVAEIPGE